jgi:hypothetical protein
MGGWNAIPRNGNLVEGSESRAIVSVGSRALVSVSTAVSCWFHAGFMELSCI